MCQVLCSGGGDALRDAVRTAPSPAPHLNTLRPCPAGCNAWVHISCDPDLPADAGRLAGVDAAYFCVDCRDGGDVAEAGGLEFD
jgi:hypothetical protein